MITERHLTIAYKLLKMRDTCRKFYKEAWKTKQAEWRPIIEACMKKNNCDELHASIILSKDLEGEEGAILAMMGTVMEMLEPNQ
jgi:hypothetical protein